MVRNYKAKERENKEETMNTQMNIPKQELRPAFSFQYNYLE
jgi:hypothetical protein